MVLKDMNKEEKISESGPVCACMSDEAVDRKSLVLKEGMGVQQMGQTQCYSCKNHCKPDENACREAMVLKEGTVLQNMGHTWCYSCKNNCKCVNKLYMCCGEGNKGPGPPSTEGGGDK